MTKIIHTLYISLYSLAKLETIINNVLMYMYKNKSCTRTTLFYTHKLIRLFSHIVNIQHRFYIIFIKVTVQLETEGIGQNEIVCPMDRSKVKL